MTSNRAWMPLHIEAYLADTGHLTALEHGAYLLLIMHYWKEGCLPSDERMIMRLAKLTREQWAESRDVLAELFLDGWRHKRIDEELAKADAIIEKRRAAAEQQHSKRRANAVHVQGKSSDTRVPTFNQEPTSETSSEVKRVPRDELRAVLDDERADAVLEHRKRIGKPMTVRAAKLLAANFAKWHDANEAADAMVRNGWQGFEPAWMGKRGPPSRNSSTFDAYDGIAAERGWANEPAILPGNNGNAQRLPAGEYGQAGAVVDLRAGTDWHTGSGDH